MTLLVAAWPPACSCSEVAGDERDESDAGEGGDDAGAAEGEGEGDGDGSEGEGEPHGCAVDTDCRAGERCLDRTCGPAPCNSDADCGAGFACTEATCRAAACAVDADCGAGHSCTGGTCVGRPCSTDAECGSLQVCFADGTCGSSPVSDPYQAFCTGTGSIAGSGGVGAGDVCLGDLARETFQFGLCACGDLGGDNASIVRTDAFRSVDGPYGHAPPLDDGHVGVNGAFNLVAKMLIGGSFVVGTGDLTLKGTSEIMRDLYAFGSIRTDGSGGQVPVGNDVYVGGDVVQNLDIGGRLYKPDVEAGLREVNDASGRPIPGTQLVELEVPRVAPCPCRPDQRVPIREIVAFGRDHNDNAVVDDPATAEDESFDAEQWADPAVSGPAVLELRCGRYYVHGIRQEQSLTLRALDRTVLFVDGDFLANGLDIVLAPGAEVDIFVTGDLAFDSATTLGDIAHPSAVRTYVEGQLGTNASAAFGGLVYAPNADLQFSGQTDVYGALFVNTAIFGGTVNVHFDSSVRTAGDSCGGGGELVSGEGEGEGEGESEGEGEGEGESGVPCLACDAAGVCDDAACLLPPGGEFSGTCGPCTTSLDCCFPSTCDLATGACVLLEG